MNAQIKTGYAGDALEATKKDACRKAKKESKGLSYHAIQHIQLEDIRTFTTIRLTSTVWLNEENEGLHKL